MNKLKFYTPFLFAALLLGCSPSEVGEEGEGDLLEPDLDPVITTHFPVTNTPLPITEDFGDGTFTTFDADDTLDFFDEPYRGLATDNPADTRQAFFYPTAGVPVTGLSLPAGNRMWITNIGGNPALQFRDARFTVGQTLPNKTATDPKAGTTIASDTESWGELDLSQPYQISFCVRYAAGGGLVQAYVDNNTSGQANSLHAGNSRIFNLAANSLTAGQRTVIRVPDPGVPDDPHVGTTNSFLQLRCESGCTAFVIDDLWIGYQSDTGTEPSGASCTATSNAVPPAVPTDLALTEGDTQLDVSWAASAFPFATSYDVAYNTSNTTAGATVVNLSGTSTTLSSLTNNIEYFVFVRGKNSNGDSAYSASESATPAPPPVPPSPPTNLVLTPGNAQIGVSWTAGANATSYDVAYNTINDPDVVDGATIVNTAATSTTLTPLVNGTEYFVFVWSKNSLGDSTSIGGSATPELPGVEDDRTWTGSELAEATYASILVTVPPAGTNNNVAAGTNTNVNGLSFFASAAGPLRHRSTVNEFNYNGSSYTTDVTTPAVGMAAPATRVYIGVPVEAGRPVNISATRRNSSNPAAAGKIVMIGSDGTVLFSEDAVTNVSATSQLVLLGSHTQTEVRIIYSREGSGGGGMHLSSIVRDYQDN
jgi:hypothetical protein